MALYGKSSKGRLQVNQVATRANHAFVWFTGAAWQFYRAVLSGPAELVIPEHTRDAFFQLWCDLRTNVPKDRNWVRHHATSLQPKTSVGYIALASFAAFVTAGGTSLLCLTLATLAALAYALLGAAVIAGLTAGFWLLVLSGVLFVSSFVIAWSATCMAAGYIFLASASAVLTYFQGLVQHRRNPLQESKRAEEAIESSSVPYARKPDSSHDISPSSHSTRGPHAHYGDSAVNGNSSSLSPSREEEYLGDISPGRVQHTLGTGDIQKTNEEGGLKQSILPYFQNHRDIPMGLLWEDPEAWAAAAATLHYNS